MKAQQRKKPVQRLYKGLVGLPPEPEAAFAPIPEPVVILETEFVDRVLVCNDCYQEFLFSAEEQASFAKDQSVPPRRCKSCEAEAIEQVKQSESTENTAVSVPSDAETILDQMERTKKEKRAQAARDRRKRQAQQLAAIKERLKIPIAVIQKEAEERAKADRHEAAQGSVNRGRYMTDAPTGKGELVTGGGSEEMELIAAARDRAVALGSSNYDDETGEEFWPENDRRRVIPEGTGQRPGDREDDGIDDDPDASENAKDNIDERGKDAPILPGSTFEVKLKGGEEYQKAHEYGLLLKALVRPCFVKVEISETGFAYCYSCGAKQEKTEPVYNCIRCDSKNSGETTHVYICRLCGLDCLYPEGHIHQIHGDENQPEHDLGFGNITRKPEKWLRRNLLISKETD
jgi:hypothetical protein